MRFARVTARAQSPAARARPLRRAGQAWPSGWRDSLSRPHSAARARGARRYSASASAKLKSTFSRIAPCAECASARFGSSSSERFAEARAVAIALPLLSSQHCRVAGSQIHRRDRQLRIGERVTRVEPDRLLVVADRFADIVGGAAIVVEISLQESVVGLDILIRRRGRGGQLRGLPVVARAARP